MRQLIAGSLTALLATTSIPVALAEQRGPDPHEPAVQAQLDALQQVRDDRAGVLHDLQTRWAPTSAGGTAQFMANLAIASDSQLLQLQAAQSWAEVQAVFGGPATTTELSPVLLQGAADVTPFVLGDDDVDYAYTAVTPCRAVDTRFGSGVIGAGSTREFYVYGSAGVMSSQGGTIACDSPKGEPRAVHLNVTVVPQGGNGNVRVYPADVATPDASLVNYRSGVNIANAAIVQTYFDLADEDVEVFSSQSAHVIIDVMGYFYATPAAGEAGDIVDIDTVEGSATTPSGVNAFIAPPATVSTTDIGQGIFVVAHAALGSSSGADNLDVKLCYRTSGSGEALTVVSSGLFDLAIAAGTRVPVGTNGVISGLPVGTYEVGMCADDDGDGGWDDNDWGVTSAYVVNAG